MATTTTTTIATTTGIDSAEELVPEQVEANPREQQPTENSTLVDTKGFSPTAPETKKKQKKKKKKKKGGSGGSLQSADDVYVYDNRFDTFKVTQDTVAGRRVVASRDLEAGELVLDEPPFAKVVRRVCIPHQCSNCLRQVHDGGGIEAGVPYAVYCSRACKTQEDALRSAEAGALGKLAGISAARDVDLDLLRMVLRLLIARARALGLQPEEKKGAVHTRVVDNQEQDEGGASVEGSFVFQQWRNLHSLMHHRESMAPEWINVIRAAAEDLVQVIPDWAHFDVEEVVELACRVNVNSHGLRDDSGSNLVIGVGLFPLTAMINHACRPNCTFAFYGGRLEVRTLEPVMAGTELTVYYIDLLQSTAERRRELLASKHFLCACPRCEDPDPVDACLDGVCCLDCGQDGCLTSTPPPSPEDVLEAQLKQLGEDLATSKPASTAGAGKGKGKKKNNGLQRENTDATITGTPNPAAVAGNVRENTIYGVAETGNDGTMYCSACGRQYRSKTVEESIARAKASWDGAMAVLRAKSFSTARKALEKWLEDYDAGSLTPPTAPKKKHVKKERVKLHPANAIVVQSLVPLANCCSFEEDYAASARHLRRAVSAMEAVYPPNYPELGDFHAALADTITAFLEKRGQALPKKSRNQAVSERKASLERAAAIRSVCLGREHPTTKEALRALARA